MIYDMLGVYPAKSPFCENFMPEAGSIAGAVKAYVHGEERQLPRRRALFLIFAGQPPSRISLCIFFKPSRRCAIGAVRRSGVAFVPTMGNLHDNHLALVREARQRGDAVIVSIFVQPPALWPGRHFDSYLRTFEADRAKLQTARRGRAVPLP